MDNETLEDLFQMVRKAEFKAGELADTYDDALMAKEISDVLKCTADKDPYQNVTVIIRFNDGTDEEVSLPWCDMKAALVKIATKKESLVRLRLSRSVKSESYSQQRNT